MNVPPPQLPYEAQHVDDFAAGFPEWVQRPMEELMVHNETLAASERRLYVPKLLN